MLAPACPKGLKLPTDVDALLPGEVGLFDVAACPIGAVAGSANCYNGRNLTYLSIG